MRHCWVWFCLVLLPIAAFAVEEPDVSGTMVVTGRVVKPDGSPVAGALVGAAQSGGRLSHRFTTTTDLQGRFRIDGLPREAIYVSADRSRYHSSRERVAPDGTEVVITAIPWDELILARHPLEEPLKQEGERTTATLRGLYRVKTVYRGEVGEECLGLDLETRTTRREGEPRLSSTVQATDDRGRRLERRFGRVQVNGRSLSLFQLPEADATSLTIEVGHEVLLYGDPILFDSMQSMVPVEKDGVALVLGKAELTEDWISPGQGAPDPQLSPYLGVRVYRLAGGRTRYDLGSVSFPGGGPDLILRNEIPYAPDALRLACVLQPQPDRNGTMAARMRVMLYGPAWVAGIRDNDVLISSDGVTWKSVTEIARYFREQPVGTKVTLRIRRGQEELQVPVVLGKWEEKLEAEAQQALALLRNFADQDAEDLALMCDELQSAGGHGEIPLPEALSVTIRPRFPNMVPEVTFEDVPVPEEMRRE